MLFSTASGARTASVNDIYPGGILNVDPTTDFVFEIFVSTETGPLLSIDAISAKVGIGTDLPDHRLSVNGEASKVGGGIWMSFSDARLKKDISDYSDGLNVINQIKPKRFKYNGLAGYPDNGKEYIGVIAQEAKSVTPYLVDTINKKLK